jgi:signal transduction histidine kinase
VQSIEKVASAYVKAAAEATHARVEIWLYDHHSKTLRSAATAGVGPHVALTKFLRPTSERDWLPCFYNDQYEASRQLPSCLPQTPAGPFAWIPLHESERNVGVLTLTYGYPHVFVKEEVDALKLFADQSAGALENSRMGVELQTAFERLKELDKLKDQFIATVGHELRTPLTSVQGYLELLRDHHKTLPEDLWDTFITNANDGCEELLTLIEKMMEGSRIRFDSQQVSLAAYELRPQIEHAIDLLDGVIKREEREVVLFVPEDCAVFVDAQGLRRVMLNLLSNALKYSPQGSRIEVSARVDTTTVEVRVRDYGLGVPEAEQSFLFERFIRLARDATSSIRGVGLGLYITRQFVQAMGGKVWVESSGQKGEGSTFAFTLQRAQLIPQTTSAASDASHS